MTAPAEAHSDTETFGRVREHLLAQGVRAVDGFGHCRYRASGAGWTTLSCAVGCLIPDGEYDASMEFQPLESAGLSRALESAGWLPSGGEARLRRARLLHALQLVHDFIDPGEWPDSLSRLEDRFMSSGEWAEPARLSIDRLRAVCRGDE